MPRALALAEVFWGTSPAGSVSGRKTDPVQWNDFIHRVEWQFKYLDAAQIKYVHSMFDPIITPVKGRNDSLDIELSTEIAGLSIYYTFDGTNPDHFIRNINNHR